MLLPSDIARLVLGYLQQEGLNATSRTFIVESPNLKEYAEHTTEDGTIPACVFSLFGKNLTTILNEYVAVKTKETSHETQIPAMMTSLWKKLDFTLNQIKCMQNSPALQQSQRLRTRNGIANMRRQRALTAAPAPSSGYMTVSMPQQCGASPAATPQGGMLGHSTPVCYTSQQTRPSTVSFGQPGDSPLQILVPDHRFNPGPLSPGRRKCDSPRRRGGSQCGASGPGRNSVVSSVLTVEQQNEETVSENFPQMVIENAREKILNDRSLQEKLAENINKILASDISPQMSKTSCSTVEQDQSIDEILGLQGEIHMTDDAIQDILEQTESDPAFQALFDLFDYGKGKTGEYHDRADGSLSNSAQESDESGLVDDSSEAANTGTGHEDSTSGGENTVRKLRKRNVQESKSKRKPPAAAPSTSKSSPGTKLSRPASESGQTGQGTAQVKNGSSRKRVSVPNQKETRGIGAASCEQLSKNSESHLSDKNAGSSSATEECTAMDVDEAVSAPMTEMHHLQDGSQTPVLENLQAFKSTSENTTVIPVTKPSELNPSAFGATVRDENGSMAETPAGETSGASSGVIGGSGQTGALPSLHIPLHDLGETGNGGPGQCLSQNKPPSLDPAAQEKEATVKEPQTRGSGNAASLTESSSLLISTSADPAAPSGSTCVSNSQTREPDPSKIVSLKIIISDEQDEGPTDSALNQATCSVTGEQIPTIFLSSPGKSPTKGLTSASSAVTHEETVQAVSSLQGTEVIGTSTPLCLNVQDNVQRQQAGEKMQETSYIQLVSANPSFGGSSSYFVVTDPSAADHHSNLVVLPSNGPQGPISAASHVVATPPRSRAVVSMSPDVSQTYSTGSTIIISSPVQPMLQSVVVPVSVVGQNTTGKFTVVPNQVLTLPCPTSVTQPVKVKSKPKLAPKDSTDSGKSGQSGSISGSKTLLQSGQSSEQQKSSTSNSSHRRMLCFDVTSDNTVTSQNTTQVNKTPSSSGAVSLSPGQLCRSDNAKSGLTKPLILGSGKAKRRVETVRLTEKSQASAAREPHKTTSNRQQKESTKSTPFEKPIDQTTKCTSSAKTSPPQQEFSVGVEGGRTSQTSDKEDEDVALKVKDTAQNISSSGPGRQQVVTSGKTKDTTKPEPRDQQPVKGNDELSGKISLQESPQVSANKENEVGGVQREQGQTAAPSSEEPVSFTLRSPTPVSQSGFGKTLCKTSPLTKQAAEMLQDIQGQNPACTPSKKQGSNCLDLPLPRTPGSGRLQEEFLEGLKTPSRQRSGRENEGTPRQLPPPATPDIPTCSPASEAGSENSINMAAHTLMILSRAARTGGPLKDSMRQEEAGSGKLAPSKTKKRKHTEPSPPAKREAQITGSSGSKKKAKKQKKLLDSFPHDLDVDKFLSSLHYDE
ncbi:protein NPAT [Chanos chanos]|uniref:Protein NPAT n=1 Tax=Chanos chanos TaxID=29144 RepID=A0A6J2VM01_CHACN|nr:protein NPAT [Chanos chanos]